MTLSDLSIARPVLSAVMSLLILLAGVASYSGLPVREYPDVDSPVVSVTTTYVGASPETVESSVTEPLEQAFNGVEGIRTIKSTSGFGASAIEVEFLPGRDIDAAATDVTNAVQRALRDIPEEAERPIVRKSGANSRPIMWLHVRGESYSAVDLTDMADRIVKTPLQILPGIANVIIGGQRKYAMRVWLDPQRMAALHVDPTDVRRAILDNNLQLPAGDVEASTRRFTVLADAQINDPDAFAEIVIREERDAPVRLKDVGWVELGSANYNTVTRFSGRPIIGVGIVKQSRSNELAVSRAVRDAMPAIRRALPDDVELEVAVDYTIFVEASLHEVWVTLAIAFCLVVIVNFLFLRSLPTTVIPSVAIPVSLLGTFAVLRVLDFSVNLLTLLAFVLAIGLLVDDAIVVMENVYRRRELGESARAAAERGSREVFFAVIATTVSLVAVLLPLSLMTGSTGRLFREFSITIAAAVCISSFVALTLVPTLCARWLTVSARHGRAYRAIEAGLGALNAGYERALAWSLRHRRAVLAFLAGNVAAGAALLAALPATLAPTEDRGQFLTIIKAPQGSTLAYTFDTLGKVEARLKAIPEVRGFFAAIGLSIGGPQSTSDGFIYTRLQPWGEREVKQQAIVGSLFGEFMRIPGALVFPINLPSLGQNTVNDVEYILKSSAAGLEEFERVSEAMLERVRRVPGLVNVDSDLRLDNPQINVVFDRDRAADLGVPVRRIAEALQVLLAQAETNEFVLRNKQYDVIPAVASRYRTVPEQIGEIHVRSDDGSMVPLSSLVRLHPTVAPATLNHYELQRAATVSASLAPGAALGEALAAVDAIAAEVLPEGFTTALGGVSREFAESSAEVYLTFVVALLFIYLVLAAQFESFIHPLTILVSVPMALLGALGSLFAAGSTMNIYSQVGIVLLVGLVTKNSILLVEYANQAHARGSDLLAAVLEAGRIRFRPILMTSVTSILGAMPLLLARGAGAESRQPIGLAVVGGLLFSTAFTLLVIPVVHLLLVGSAERWGWIEAADREAGAEPEPTP
jgi:multidrug efflux pump